MTVLPDIGDDPLMLFMKLSLDNSDAFCRFRIRSSGAAKTHRFNIAEFFKHLFDFALGRVARQVADEHGPSLLLLVSDLVLGVFVAYLLDDVI